MKTKLFKFFSLLGLMLLTIAVVAQTPVADTTGLDSWKIFDGPVTIGKLNAVYEPLYSAIVIVWGFIAKSFNIKSRKIPFVFVVAAGGLVAGAAFIFSGFSATPVIISFLMTLGIFDLLIKPSQRALTKKPEIKVAV